MKGEECFSKISTMTLCVCLVAVVFSHQGKIWYKQPTSTVLITMLNHLYMVTVCSRQGWLLSATISMIYNNLFLLTVDMYLES